MMTLANQLWDTLLTSSSKDSDRADHVINLGITDQKVHKQRRTTITGNPKLLLMSTWSKKQKIGLKTSPPNFLFRNRIVIRTYFYRAQPEMAN